INRKTADLQSGIDGVTERFENLQVGGENLLPNAGFEGAKDSSERFTVGGITYTNKTIPHWQNLYNSGIQNPTTSYHAIYRELFEGKGPVIEFNESDGSRNWKAICAVLQASNLNFGNYTFSADIYTTGVGTKVWFGFYYYNKVGVRNFHSGQTTINITTINDWHRVSGAIKLNNDIDLTKDVRFYIYAFGFTANSILYLTKPQLEEGTVATQFRLAQETLRSEIVTYKRTADEASAELSRQIQTVDGKAVDAKTYAQQTATAINTRLESLETYKNAEGTRASQYFTASRDETARQVTALRTAVTDGYVAKAKYEEDVRGVTQKFEELSSATDTKIAEHKNTVDGRFATIQASVDSKANQVDFQAVKETAQLYERIIGSTETGIKDKVARMVMADSLFLTEVKDKISGTATQVNQLSNSWAVKNLTSAGTVLNQFNLLANGTNRIDGRLTHITGQTLIDNGVINNAMIGNLDAGKITTGTLDAARIKANSIDGSKMVFDQAFVNKMTANEALFKQLFAQSAFITSVQAVTMSAGQIVGGVLKATNGAAEFDLNNAKLAFNSSATIEFNSSGNALIRKVGDVTGFLHFNNATAGGTYVGLGVTSHNEGVKSQNTGRFAGIRIFRSNDTTDQTEIYGDKIYLGHGFNGNGITITATKLSTSYELVDVINSIRALWRCWLHWNGTGWNPDDMAMRRSVINEYNTYNIG
ncbi:TPA: hypothetical protein U0592_002202, partial [Streptococcus suis]|nr:hypothetical protein [Streptococcus suis]